jgi:hypothetical protein
LAPDYVRRYVGEVLERFDASVLFLIERIPAACHRSLVAPRLAQVLHAREIIDLIP